MRTSSADPVPLKCGRLFQHRVVVGVDDVEVAGGTRRHAVRAVRAREGQHLLGGRAAISDDSLGLSATGNNAGRRCDDLALIAGAHKFFVELMAAGAGRSGVLLVAVPGEQRDRILRRCRQRVLRSLCYVRRAAFRTLAVVCSG